MAAYLTPYSGTLHRYSLPPGSLPSETSWGCSSCRDLSYARNPAEAVLACQSLAPPMAGGLASLPSTPTARPRYGIAVGATSLPSPCLDIDHSAASLDFITMTNSLSSSRRRYLVLHTHSCMRIANVKFGFLLIDPVAHLRQILPFHVSPPPPPPLLHLHLHSPPSPSPFRLRRRRRPHNPFPSCPCPTSLASR